MSTVTYGPLELPSGKKIKFRNPLGSDHSNVLQMTPISSDRALSGAMLVDDYVAASCVTEVDGRPTDGDYKRLMDDWEQKDILFYRTVFDNMFNLGQDDVSKAKDAAAFLLSGSTSIAGSSSPGNAE